MRKIILALAIIGVFYSTFSSGQIQVKIEQARQSIQTDQEWELSLEQKWKGADNLWYKLDGDQVMKSKDGQNWEMIYGNTFETIDGGMYRYYEGKLYKLANGQLWRLTDGFIDAQGNACNIDEQGNLLIRY
ncbi:MAG: hypothetical protein H0V01_03615 [Bacteroidetes bacterium]|nr:hypothetical protein [Bacteroidota bacterium]HET6245524.1 hypothetical protein [Bacteroidia bacterium]